jgi:Sulfotransferase family
VQETKVAFGDLVTKGLKQFLQDDRFDDSLCVFIHIPKTAGSSLTAELDRLRPPYLNIHRRYSTEEPITFSSIEQEIANAIASGAMAEASSCSGHFNHAQAEPIRTARPDARFVSFLRDPVARVISDYRYARTPAHPTYRTFIDRFPRIEDYVAAKQTQNKMARFLLPVALTEAADIETFVSTNLAFVGVLELYPMSFNILSRLLGAAAMPVEHQRKTEPTAENLVDDSPDLRRLILQHNARDQLLYDIVRRKLVAVQDEWRDMRLCESGKAA